MTDLSGAGISVDLPAGWGGEISSEQTTALGSDGTEPPPGARRSSVVHLANFVLPQHRGTFGDGAVELMTFGDVLMVLYEYDSSAAETGLFAHLGTPGPVKVGDFDRYNLQRTIPGQSGIQLFFSEAGRAFCWYIVVGSHFDRIDSLPMINHILGSLVIEP
jgi:hypothetical protein